MVIKCMIVYLYVECVCIHVEDTVSFLDYISASNKKKEQLSGWYKTWTLDSGLDCGLDYGLDYGLD